MSEQKVLKAIRAKCLECALTKTEVKRCEMKDCALYPYRISLRKEGKKVLHIEPKSVSGLLFNL